MKGKVIDISSVPYMKDPDLKGSIDSRRSPPLYDSDKSRRGER